MVRSLLIAGTALLLVLPLAAQQQNSSSSQQSSSSAQQQNSSSGQQSAAQQKKQDKKSKDKKDSGQASAADRNPFPLAESEKAQQQAQQQNQQQNPPAAPAPAAAPSSQPQKGSAADQNPFPLAESEKAQQEAEQRQNAAQRQENAARNNQNEQDSSSSVVKGLNLPTGSSSPAAGPGIASQLDPSLGRKDTRVGDFYLETGDWKGAYDRFLEATEVDPGDAEAVYGLAASAQQLGYRKVAIQNYQLYLSAIPRGHRAKDCRRALKEMGVQQ